MEQPTTDLEKTSFASNQHISCFTIGCSCFTIGYGNEGDFNLQVFHQMTQTTGGYYFKGNPETISRVMDNLQLEF